MAQIVIRDIPADVVSRLQGRATANGTTLQAELRGIIEQAAAVDFARARRLASKLRRSIRVRGSVDTTRLIRADRDR